MPANLEDEKALEEHHKRRADWQLALLGHLKSLEARQMVEFKSHDEITWALTAEGYGIAHSGSQEARLWAALPTGGEEAKTLDELKKELGADVLKIGQGKAFAKKWARKHPSQAGALTRMPGVDSIVDDTAEDLREVRRSGTLGDDKKLADLKKRKLVAQKCVRRRQGGRQIEPCGTDVLSPRQEAPLVLDHEGPAVQPQDREARDRSLRRDASVRRMEDQGLQEVQL